MSTYIKHEEIQNAKQELKSVNVEIGTANAKIEKYNGMSEDLLGYENLKVEQERLVNLIDTLKDFGRVA